MMIDQRDRKAELGAVRYERIGDTGLALLYAIRSALMADMLIQAGFYVGESFHAYRPGQVLDPPSDGGGHAMVIYGYDNGRWLLRNSHGERYGDAGNLMISDAYMMTARDPWVARSAPPFSDTP